MCAWGRRYRLGLDEEDVAEDVLEEFEENQEESWAAVTFAGELLSRETCLICKALHSALQQAISESLLLLAACCRMQQAALYTAWACMLVLFTSLPWHARYCVELQDALCACRLATSGAASHAMRAGRMRLACGSHRGPHAAPDLAWILTVARRAGGGAAAGGLRDQPHPGGALLRDRAAVQPGRLRGLAQGEGRGRARGAPPLHSTPLKTLPDTQSGFLYVSCCPWLHGGARQGRGQD